MSSLESNSKEVVTTADTSSEEAVPETVSGSVGGGPETESTMSSWASWALVILFKFSFCPYTCFIFAIHETHFQKYVHAPRSTISIMTNYIIVLVGHLNTMNFHDYMCTFFNSIALYSILCHRILFYLLICTHHCLKSCKHSIKGGGCFCAGKSRSRSSFGTGDGKGLCDCRSRAYKGCDISSTL